MTVTNPTPGGGTSANTGPWISTGAMTASRASHTQTLLQSGKVLVAGGGWFSGLVSNVSASAELFDPASRTFVTTGSMATPRAFHTATILGSGKVLVAGGSSASVNGSPAMGALASAETFDPSTGTFSLTGSMVSARMYHTATPLADGTVLVAGGVDSKGNIIASAEIYNPTTGKFTATGAMSASRFGHTAALLPNGEVLIAGGESLQASATVDLGTAELYNPATGKFIPTGNLAISRESAIAVTLDNGTVLVAGGYQYPSGFLTEAEIYDPTKAAFTPTGSMGTPRNLHSAVLLGDGTVLVVGGSDGSTALASAEIYTPTTGRFTPTWTMSAARLFAAATTLSDGSVLVSGGEGNSGVTQLLASAEVYPPPSSSAGTAAAEFTVNNPVPTITKLSAATAPSGTQVVITGNNFVGNSEVLLNGLAVPSYGDPTKPEEIWFYPSSAGSYTITVNNPSPGGGISNSTNLDVTVNVQVTPVRALWYPGSSNPFSAMVLGTSDTNVIWSVREGTAGGTITSSGVYTAPSTSGTYHVVATSDADQGQSAIATVIVSPDAGQAAYGPQMTTYQPDTTAVLLNNGRVLLAGNSSAEIYDPSAGLFTSTGAMPVPRINPVAVLLADGRALVAGGSEDSGASLAPGAETYDPTTGVFSPAASMALPTRSPDSLTALPNGKVLVIGSEGDALDGATTELFDPSTGTFSFTGSMATARGGLTAKLLTNGKVLIAGGGDYYGNQLSTAELYDPVTGTFSSTGSMTVPKLMPSSVLLGNGKVLIVGGDWTYYGGSAEVYDPSSGKFAETTTPPVYPLYGPLAGTLLPNGLVFIGGGALSNGTPFAPYSNRTQFYDPASGLFYAGPLLADAMGNCIALNSNAMTLLPSGSVLIAGFSGANDKNTVIYTPGSANPIPASALAHQEEIVKQSGISHPKSNQPVLSLTLPRARGN